jgi:hypothetical protein
VANTRPCRQLRGHVNNLLASVEQPQGDVPTDALTTLDRPDPVRPALGVLHHRRVAVAVSAEPATAGDGLLAGHDLDGGGAFVRVHADDHAL